MIMFNFSYINPIYKQTLMSPFKKKNQTRSHIQHLCHLRKISEM